MFHWRLLAKYGFTGAESAVRRWARQHLRPTGQAITVPLVQNPGVDAQVDPREALVGIGDVTQPVQPFCPWLAPWLPYPRRGLGRLPVARGLAPLMEPA